MLWKYYHHAASFQEAAALLSKSPEKTRVIAGGTDLLVEKRNGLRKEIETLIDISRIPGTGRIQVENGVVHLDACVTHSDCVASPILRQYAKLLVQACHSVGSPQIRNRGTVAGNVVTASPANDAITPLMALDANIHLLSTSGRRTVPIREFYKGVRRTVMHADEIVTGISFKALENHSQSIFMKHALRNAQAISLLNCAVILDVEDEIITRAVVTLGAVAPVIIHATFAEEALKGRKISEVDMEEIGGIAAKDAAPISDVRSSGEYRSAMVKVLVKRGLSMLRNVGVHDLIPASLLWGQPTNPLHDAQFPPSVSGHEISCIVNGQEYHRPYQPGMTLLQFLRDHLHLTGSKEGCGEGECGACTIYLDGAAVLACLTPAERAHGAEIITIEGLASAEALHPMQQAFVDEGAVQCGFCTPGFIMSAAKLLEENPSPTQAEIKEAISGNLCRCTGYYKIIRAIEKASKSKTE
jgi:carbon-monoxide dehydrogenase medium subunit